MPGWPSNAEIKDYTIPNMSQMSGNRKVLWFTRDSELESGLDPAVPASETRSEEGANEALKAGIR